MEHSSFPCLQFPATADVTTSQAKKPEAAVKVLQLYPGITLFDETNETNDSWNLLDIAGTIPLPITSLRTKHAAQSYTLFRCAACRLAGWRKWRQSDGKEPGYYCRAYSASEFRFRLQMITWFIMICSGYPFKSSYMGYRQNWKVPEVNISIQL
jgi:hypothetical protein